ncbi:helix-turn-helix transcriptional regulator [Natronorubrum aibiense]|uniref:Transcription regulator PadR N-terminal domain-containing protein n=1 Tax=Natronorubrum aibiense TaxID=348826 RepID=A0A5P9P600_9EURY|nr:helix-turn-helix transcriptional regulator [Natronorubrum aibiense]QFU83367.1 hypothetical protein GCU68_12875 [Natronorubrum aibiense]
MNYGTPVGRTPHARQEESPAKRSDARCICGARASGYDARRKEKSCRLCASIRPDGGSDTGSSGEQPQVGVGWGELSGFQRDIIEIIARLQSAGVASYGLAIEEELEEYYYDIPHSRLYRNLNCLIDDGFVELSELDGRTNSYTLLPESKALLEENVYRRAEACGLQVSEADGDDKPQTIDCDCGESFAADVENGPICPNCGRGSEDRGEP